MAIPITSFESKTVQCAASGCERGAMTRGLCSKHYQMQRTHGSIVHPTKRCVHCGAEFTGRSHRKYCNRRCSWVAAGRRKGARPLAEFLAEQRAKVHRICPECGDEFHIDRRGSRPIQRYCSIRCSHAEANRQRKVEEIRREFARWARQAKPKASKPIRQCKCGAELGRFEHRCAECRDEHIAAVKASYKQTETYRRLKRAGRTRRRAVERGRLGDAERFDPLEILARDGWRCHICGVRTPKRLRGTYDDRAPELDHILPLAVGGEHTRINTACACRRCNSAKGCRHIGQLRLIA